MYFVCLATVSFMLSALLCLLKCQMCTNVRNGGLGESGAGMVVALFYGIHVKGVPETNIHNRVSNVFRNVK